MKKIQSTCNLCALACNVDFHVEENKIVKVLPTVDYPVNKGFSCIKGIRLDKQQTKIKPTKKPLLRDKNGEMKEVEWDEAFEVFAKRMTDIQKEHGEESIAYISTGQMATEEMALLGHVGRNYLKMPGDGNTRLCMATSVVAHKQSFGFDAPPYTLNDAELSDTIILIGANPVIAHPIFWGRIKENKDAKIVVIDPRKSETAMNAHTWLDIEPKGDLDLLYTLANVIIEKDYIDKNYINENTEGFEDFKEFVKNYTLEDVEERCGIDKERVIELAETINNGKRVSFWWTMGVNQSYQGVRTAQAIINLALMTGNIGRPGTGANSLTGQSNAMGSRAFSNTAGLFGGGDFDNPVRRTKVAKALNVDESVLATKPTIPYNVIIENALKGDIKGLWIVCTNPRHSWTNNEEFQKAAEKLDFLVVQDIYKDTDTALISDLFLPSVPGIKKEGVFINTERRLSKLNPVINKEEGELSDFEIILGIGEKLGMGDLLDGWRTPRETFETLKRCSEGMPCDITGVTYEMLEGNNMEGSRGVQWPFRKGDILTEDERRLYEDGKFYTPSKKAKFIFEASVENPLPTNEEYPYVFNSGRGTVGQWHTSVRSREISEGIDAYSKSSYVLVHPKTAKKLNLSLNERVSIESMNGVTSDFDVKITDTVKETHLYAPIHYVETNALTPSVFDPYSKEPSYKTVPVKIIKK
ncbi:MAG: molybdopterin-dependent oxidoreductase [Peptostreptococcaceae bacterium]